MSTPGEPDRSILPAWAHRAGLLDLGPALAIRGDVGNDRAACCERIARYCWAYDERRRDRLAECFTDDAVWEGSVLGQVAVGPFAGRDTIVDWLARFWPHQHDQRRHMLLNTIVEGLDEAAATMLSYLLLMSSTGTTVSVESMGFYRVECRREGAAWRISRLIAGFDKPFWPGQLEALSERGRVRHGIAADA